MKRLQKARRLIDRAIRCYWLPLALGFIAAGVMVIVARQERGSFAIGGEWCIPAWFCLIHYGVRFCYRIKERRARRGRISRQPQAARR